MQGDTKVMQKQVYRPFPGETRKTPPHLCGFERVMPLVCAVSGYNRAWLVVVTKTCPEDGTPVSCLKKAAVS